MQILILDDEPLAVNHLKKQVSLVLPEGEITTFLLAEPALAYLQTQQVDILFVDIEMPCMNGLEFARRTKAIQPKANIIFVTGFSHYALDAFGVHASGYLLKPAMSQAVSAAIENLRFPITETIAPLQVQTFGNFEVFVHGKPLNFPRSKSKELFAYLIDRRGASVTIGEIAAILFEDKPLNRSLQSQIQTLISVMMNVFRRADMEHVIIKKRNSLAVDVSMVSCDYYNFLKGDSFAINSFTNEYMSNYGWSEFTVGALVVHSQKNK